MMPKLEEAEGYLMLGMLDDAWEVVEDLAPEERTSREALDLRLRILTRMKKWELGKQIAELLEFDDRIESQKSVARFLHARAKDCFSRHEFTVGQSAIKKAVEIWPDIRLELSDGDLNALTED